MIIVDLWIKCGNQISSPVFVSPWLHLSFEIFVTDHNSSIPRFVNKEHLVLHILLGGNLGLSSVLNLFLDMFKYFVLFSFIGGIISLILKNKKYVFVKVFPCLLLFSGKNISPQLIHQVLYQSQMIHFHTNFSEI